MAGSRGIGRRIGAVIAGLATNMIVTTATDMVLHATGVFPPLGQRMAGALFVLALAYRIVFGIAGCYVAARLAPDRPRQHAVALGVVGIVISGVGTIVMWGAGPAWYPLALIATALPCGWIGGGLRERQLAVRGAVRSR